MEGDARLQSSQSSSVPRLPDGGCGYVDACERECSDDPWMAQLRRSLLSEFRAVYYVRA